VPDILDDALLGYLTHAVAHPPPGTIPRRPRLSGGDDPLPPVP